MVAGRCCRMVKMPKRLKWPGPAMMKSLYERQQVGAVAGLRNRIGQSAIAASDRQLDHLGLVLQPRRRFFDPTERIRSIYGRRRPGCMSARAVPQIRTSAIKCDLDDCACFQFVRITRCASSRDIFPEDQVDVACLPQYPSRWAKRQIPARDLQELSGRHRVPAKSKGIPGE